MGHKPYYGTVALPMMLAAMEQFAF